MEILDQPAPSSSLPPSLSKVFFLYSITIFGILLLTLLLGYFVGQKPFPLVLNPVGWVALLALLVSNLLLYKTVLSPLSTWLLVSLGTLLLSDYLASRVLKIMLGGEYVSYTLILLVIFLTHIGVNVVLYTGLHKKKVERKIDQISS